MKMKRPSLYAFFIFLCLVFGFNNCSQNFLTHNDGETNLASEASSAVVEGKTIYDTNCSACHGPIETSSKRGRTASDITTAIGTQTPMKFLSFLTADEITLLAAALSAPVPTTTLPPPPVGQPSDYKALSANRFMLKSNFKELFITDGTMDASDTSIDTIIENHIGSHPEAFGGNCSRYDTGCSASCGPYGDSECMGKLQTSAEASPTPNVSAITQGYLVRACEEILAVDKSVQTVALKAGLSTAAAPNLSDIQVLMDFILRGKPADSAAANGLLQVADQARLKGYPILDQWRFAILPLCVSSATEML